MATRKTSSKKTSTRQADPIVIEETVQSVVVTSNPSNTIVLSKSRVMLGLVLIIGLLLLFWYKTNSWPIAALVNGRPISRFALNQELYKQGGQQVLDGMISQTLVESELDRQNVELDEAAVTARIDEIKANLGESYETALAAQGLSEAQLRDQLSTQIRLETLLSPQATVSAEEVEALVDETTTKEQAEDMLKQQKLQELIAQWVEDIRSKAKIRLIGTQ